jgi:hypothetical protein
MEQCWNCAADNPLPADEIIAALSPQWQDIATAPKDGTAVLVYYSNTIFWTQDGSVSTKGELRDYVERLATGFY